MKCEHCNNRQFIPQGKKMIPCPYCVTEERLMASLKRAVADAKKDKKWDFANKIEIILSYLPEYPVMAILEAEEMGLNENLILMIRDSFNVRPFMDAEYKSVS
jgi:hypothetical protein